MEIVASFQILIYLFSTNQATLTLTAIQHIATGTIKTEEKVDDITVVIK